MWLLEIGMDHPIILRGFACSYFFNMDTLWTDKKGENRVVQISFFYWSSYKFIWKELDYVGKFCREQV